MFLDFKERIGVMGYDSYYLELVWVFFSMFFSIPHENQERPRGEQESDLKDFPLLS